MRIKYAEIPFPKSIFNFSEILKKYCFPPLFTFWKSLVIVQIYGKF